MEVSEAFGLLTGYNRQYQEGFKCKSFCNHIVLLPSAFVLPNVIQFTLYDVINGRKKDREAAWKRRLLDDLERGGTSVWKFLEALKEMCENDVTAIFW